MSRGEMEAVSLHSRKAAYKRKGYYRKLAFFVLAFVYLASVCVILLIRHGNFFSKSLNILSNEEGKRLRRDAGLDLESLTSGKSKTVMMFFVRNQYKAHMLYADNKQKPNRMPIHITYVHIFRERMHLQRRQLYQNFSCLPFE